MKKPSLVVEKVQVGRHWDSHGCERGPSDRESVEAGMQMHGCGQKMKSPNERLVCLLFFRACSVFRDTL